MSEIITNKLTGKTAAGNVTITSEGGSATMQLQQGVAKVWTLDETLADNSTLAESTFNVSSTTDNGTGDLHISFTNSFSTNNYVGQSTNAGFSANDIVTCRYGESTTGKDDLRNYDSAYKDASISYTAHGDLA